MKAVVLEVKNSVKYKEPRTVNGKTNTHGSVAKVRCEQGEKDIWSWENAYSDISAGDVIYLKQNGQYLNYDPNRKFTPLYNTLTGQSLLDLKTAISKQMQLPDGKEAPLHIVLELSKLCEETGEIKVLINELLTLISADKLCYLSQQTFAEVAAIVKRDLDLSTANISGNGEVLENGDIPF
jgi:hypothetical protein